MKWVTDPLYLNLILNDCEMKLQGEKGGNCLDREEQWEGKGVSFVDFFHSFTYDLYVGDLQNFNLSAYIIF